MNLKKECIDMFFFFPKNPKIGLKKYGILKFHMCRNPVYYLTVYLDKKIIKNPIILLEKEFVCGIKWEFLLCLLGVLKSFRDLRRVNRQITWTPAAPVSPLLIPHQSSDKGAARGAIWLTNMCDDPQKYETWIVCMCRTSNMLYN